MYIYVCIYIVFNHAIKAFVLSYRPVMVSVPCKRLDLSTSVTATCPQLTAVAESDPVELSMWLTVMSV